MKEGRAVEGTELVVIDLTTEAIAAGSSCLSITLSSLSSPSFTIYLHLYRYIYLYLCPLLFAPLHDFEHLLSDLEVSCTAASPLTHSS